MRALTALLAFALLAAGCSQRDRANPLDPVNPQTGGRPEGFNAVAGFSVISITWTPRPDLAIDGFQLWRLAPGDSLYRELGTTREASSNSYLDSGVPNSQRFHYRLYYVVDGQRGGRPAEDEATAGPVRPYLADPGNGEIARLSPDGRDVLLRWRQFGEAQSIALDPGAGYLWASSYSSSIVANFEPAGTGGVTLTGMQSPYSIAVDPQDHTAWICDLAGSLHHRNLNGSAASPGQINLLDGPIGVAVGPDRSVWVCEGDGNRVRHWNSAGTPVGTAFLAASPSRVAVDSLTHIAWVTSLSGARLWRIAENGSVIDSSTATGGAIGIAIDRPRGRVWVADATGNRVLALDIGTLAVLRVVTSIGEPRSIAVDAATGQVWVVARAERAVLRLSSDGTVLDRIGGLGSPSEIALDPGQ